MIGKRVDERDAMRLAMALARLGCGWTHPNPRVGAVAVRDGRVVGIGTHLRFGGPHAEATLIANADAAVLRGAALYVNLEPCGHFGKTPPCAEAIARAGIAKVVAAIGDPGPCVQGRGFEFLRAHSILFETGRERAAAARLNAPYLIGLKRGRAMVTAKIAASLDGRLAAQDGSSRWVSGPGARELVHRWRASCDAIVIGRGTFVADRPRLDARPRRDPLKALRAGFSAAGGSWPHQPARIVVDSRARIGGDDRAIAHMANSTGGPWVVACGRGADDRARTRLQSAGVQCWVLPEQASGGVDLAALMCRTAEEGWLDVIVEGGRALLSELIRARLVDRLRLFIAPALLGGDRTWTADLGVTSIEEKLPFTRVRARETGRDAYLESWSPDAHEVLRGVMEDPPFACSPA